MAGVALLLAVAGAWALLRPGEPAADPARAARTSFPGLPAPTADATLDGLESAAPPPGSVVRVPGPFDERIRLTGLRLEEGAVTGAVTVTSDVSELLDLEVLAGFYDRDGTLLATGRHVEHLDESAGHPEDGPPALTHPFRVPVPAAIRGRVVGAAVGVPVLVNE